MSRRIVVTIMAVGLCLTVPAGADVFNMPGDLISVEFVSVQNTSNTADTTGYGAVAYGYNMATYEVTAGQYTEFLNAVAVTDTYGLWNTYMWNTDPWGGDMGCKIQQSGSAGSYTYSVAADRANRPVNYVSWGDAARFSNWLHNGQPIGSQGNGTTETGAYTLDGAITDGDLLAVTREESARYMLPSDDEWYKAAYHKNNGDTGDYFDYTTSSDRTPAHPFMVDGDPDTYTPPVDWDWNAADTDDEYGPYNAVSVVGNNGYFPGYYTPGYWQSEVDYWPNSESPYDTLNQGGNIEEWTEGTGMTDFPSYPGYVTRGGSWDLGVHQTKSDWRKAFVPTHEDRRRGFRVAQEFNPFPPGDFDLDGDVDDEDIDMLCDFIRGALPYDALYDISGPGEDGVPDGLVDTDDLDYHVHALVQTLLGNGTEYGDFNLDGMVELTDLTRLATNYGDNDWKWDDGNANRNIDTNIDNTDLTILATYYGFGMPDVVPEPMTLFVMGCGCGAIGLLRRRRRA